MYNNVVNERSVLLPRREIAWNFRLQPAIFIVFFGWNLSAAIIPSQLLKETCLFKGYNKTDCMNPVMNNVTLEIEEEIQPLVAKIIMTISLMNGIVPGVLSLFLGPWTDKFGRKKVICAGYLGHALALAGFCLLSLVSEVTAVNPWIYVLPYLPVVLTGGWPTMIISTLCYVTDLTNNSNRSTRLAITEMAINLGILSGMASCSFVLQFGHPVAVFLVSTISTLLAAIYTMFFVEESVKEPNRASSCDQIRELVSVKAVKGMIITCFRKRAMRERAIIWCLMLIMVFTVSSTNASHSVYYLFVREKFRWSLKEASLFDSLTLLISILGSMLALTFLKPRFRVPDVVLAILAIGSFLVDAVIRSGAQSTRTMYIASSISLLKFLTLPMCRSLIASVVHINEIGKIYSFTSSFEAVATLVASPLYTYVYSRTFTFYTGAFYFITIVVCLINFALIYTVMRLKQRREILMNQNIRINN